MNADSAPGPTVGLEFVSGQIHQTVAMQKANRREQDRCMVPKLLGFAATHAS